MPNKVRKYPHDYCLADVAAYGPCILWPRHNGAHEDASGHRFTNRANTESVAVAMARVASVARTGSGRLSRARWARDARKVVQS